MKKSLIGLVFFCVSFALCLPLFAAPVVSDPSYSVELVASDLGFAHGVDIGPTGNIFVSTNEGPIFRINEATYEVTKYDFGFIYGMNLAFDSTGTLFALSGDGNPRLLTKILSFNPPTSSYFSQGYHTVGLAVGPDGSIYLGNTGDGTISRVGPSRGVAQTFLSGLHNPRGICFDGEGNLYIAESDTGKIFKATPPYTLPSVIATLGWGPTFITADSAGALYVSSVSPSPTIYKISGSTVTTFATGFLTGNAPYGLKFDADGSLFAADGPYLWKFSYTNPPDVFGCIELKGLPAPSGAPVQLKQERQDTQTSYTDTDGCYEFEHLVTGKSLDLLIEGLVVTDRSPSPPPAVSGCIELKGAPAPSGLAVQLKQKKQDPQTTSTDGDGCYQFENVVPGRSFDITIKVLVVD